MMKVKANGCAYNVYADLHTHTLYSGHAMASPEEMVKKARELGLEYIALTEHVYDYTAKHDIENQNLLPQFMHNWLSDEQITVIGGREMNIFTNNPAKERAGLNLCAWHSWFGPSVFTPEEALSSHEFLRPYTHVFCHPERTAILLDTLEDGVNFMSSICQMIVDRGCAAKSRIGYVEINTSSLDDYRDIKTRNKMIRLQEQLMITLTLRKFKNIFITLGSDAHCTGQIARNFGEYLYRLEGFGLLDRVVNVNRDLIQELIDDTNLE